MIASASLRLTEEEITALGERAFFVRDGILGEHAARALHAELTAFIASGALRPAGVSGGAGYRVDAETRGDAIAWLEPAGPPDALDPLRAYLCALRESLNRHAYLGLDRFDVQLACYPGDGARYRRHRDAVPGRGSRRVTVIYYVNPGWRADAGGLLRLHLPDGPVDVEPILDRLVVFLSERVEHEVLPVAAPRLAVTAWFHGRG
jgi:SM-20-related protein